MENASAAKINFRWNFASLGNCFRWRPGIPSVLRIHVDDWLVFDHRSLTKSIRFWMHGLIHTSKITCFNDSKQLLTPTLGCTPRSWLLRSFFVWSYSTSHLTSMAHSLKGRLPAIPKQTCAAYCNVLKLSSQWLHTKCWASQSRTSLWNFDSHVNVAWRNQVEQVIARHKASSKYTCETGEAI